MKREMPVGVVVGVVLLVIALVAFFFLRPQGSPSGQSAKDLDDAGIGLPAKAGGGTMTRDEDPARKGN